MYIVFPGSSDSKESACNSGDLGSIPGLERSPGEGKDYPLQHSKYVSCLRDLYKVSNTVPGFRGS